MEAGEQRVTSSWYSKGSGAHSACSSGVSKHTYIIRIHVGTCLRRTYFLKESQLLQEQMVLRGQPRAGEGRQPASGEPWALPHPCPHHLCDCGPVTPTLAPVLW